MDLSKFAEWAGRMWKFTIINEAGQTRLGWPAANKDGMMWIHGPDVETVIRRAMSLDKVA